MARTERPRWLVNAQSFVGHALVEPGTEVYYTPTEDADGKSNGVGHNLTPLNDEAQAIVDAQAKDHPDKTKHAARRKAAADKAADEAEAVEQEKGDGPVPKSQAKGDTKSENPAKGGKKDAKQAEGGADDDIG